MPEPGARAYNCINYEACLDAAARLDAHFPQCPCERFQNDRNAIRWRDVAASEHLVLAILRPDCYDLLLAIMATVDGREKWRLLRSAWRGLKLPKRGIL
jgi:hypothetical protein